MLSLRGVQNAHVQFHPWRLNFPFHCAGLVSRTNGPRSSERNTSTKTTLVAACAVAGLPMVVAIATAVLRELTVPVEAGLLHGSW